MPIDVQILSGVNLVTQLLLGAVLVGGAYLAKSRKSFLKHCLLMRIGVAVQIVAIALVMAPATMGYLSDEPRDSYFNFEMVVHAALGLTVVGLWVYINLVVEGIIKRRGRPVIAMRLAFTCWAVALLLGLHLYTQVWL